MTKETQLLPTILLITFEWSKKKYLRMRAKENFEKSSQKRGKVFVPMF